jgi:uncharacterized protein (DUF2336 family)
MKLLEKIFPPKKQKLSDDIERALAEKGLERQRRALAENEQTSQEILYFLAEKDDSVKVRRAVAGNPSTPLQAAPILAKDADSDVRLILARRLVKVLPDLSQDRYSQLYAFAVQSLGLLALDEVLKIRRALTETLKDHAHTPPSIAAQLARDLEREVSEPILRFCAALGDDDIVDILKSHPAGWAAEAVANRKTLSPRVSQAVIDTGNPRAGSILLSNAGAEIDLPLLEAIVERAREYPEWHKPLATRKALPPLMAMKLSAYVDGAVKKILLERSDLDAVTIGEITAIVKRRAAYEAQAGDKAQEQDAYTRAQAFQREHGITEDSLGDAIAMRDDAFVVACLALCAQTTPENVQKIFDVRAPKSICALSWKAGFSMRFALRLQQTLGRVPPSSLIYPRYGTDYPFPEEDMKAFLRLIDV